MTSSIKHCLGATALSLGAVCQAGDDPAPVYIDQAAALAGHVTPGDAPGFPVTLSRPGRYQLASDLIVPADTGGIVIDARDVRLDLAGHAVSGPVHCRQDTPRLTVACDAASRFSAVVGISSVAASGAWVHHGRVEGFAGLGVHYGEGTVLEALQVRHNAGVGIAGAGYATPGVVRGARVELNGGPGIVCEHMLIETSTFAANGGTGVDCRGSWFNNSVTRDNGGQGLAEGARHGLRSHGNRLADDDIMATDRLPAPPNARR